MAASAQLFSKRPDVLSTTVGFTGHDPVVFAITVNGQQLASRRASTLNELGEAPYTGRLQRSFDIDLEWIESFSKQAYSASFSIPADGLSTIDADGHQAYLSVQFGRGGEVRIETVHPELNAFLREGREAEITPEIDAPVLIESGCGTLIDPQAPRHAELASWLDPQAMERAEGYRADALTKIPGGPAPGICNGGG